jgi:hypothetical protein
VLIDLKELALSQKILKYVTIGRFRIYQWLHIFNTNKSLQLLNARPQNCNRKALLGY